MQTVLALRSVSKRFPGRSGGTIEILRDLDLLVSKGETVAITGRSGSGKSTLLSLIAGLDRPDEGSVELDGRRLDSLRPDELATFRGERLGIVFQQFHLLPHLSALENASLPLELAGRADARNKAAALLDAVGLSHRLDHRPGELSGGECQRVAIARALAPEPSLLLADEPTGNLDEASHQGVADLLFRLTAAHGGTLLLVTHSGSLASRCARRLDLSGGKLLPA